MGKVARFKEELHVMHAEPVPQTTQRYLLPCKITFVNLEICTRFQKVTFFVYNETI